MSENKQLFIIGSGRSGTTLVQRLFNTFPNVLVWGEHAGFLKEISDAYFNLTQNPSMFEYSYSQAAPEGTEDSMGFYKRPERWQAWNNWFHPDDVKQLFRDYIESFFNPKKIGESEIWGFKEIRYGKNDRVLEFIKELYPEAQFIFITRNGLNTLESQLTTFHQGESRFLMIKRILQLPTAVRIAYEWALQNRYLMHLSKQDNNSFHLFQFETLVKNINVLDPILNNLGLELGEQQLKVMKMKEGRGSGLEQTSVDQRWKRLGFIPANIAELLLGTTNKQLGYQAPKRLLVASFLGKIADKLLFKKL